MTYLLNDLFLRKMAFEFGFNFNFGNLAKKLRPSSYLVG